MHSQIFYREMRTRAGRAGSSSATAIITIKRFYSLSTKIRLTPYLPVRMLEFIIVTIVLVKQIIPSPSYVLGTALQASVTIHDAWVSTVALMTNLPHSTGTIDLILEILEKLLNYFYYNYHDVFFFSHQ